MPFSPFCAIPRIVYFSVFAYNGETLEDILMKRKKKGLRIVLIAVLCLLFLLGLGPNGVMLLHARSRILTPEELDTGDWDCILVLGAGLQPDGSPSLMLRERIDMGIRLYGSGAAPKLLMSGDHGRADHDEVNAMKDAALAAGIPSEDVFMDHAGFSTYDSLYRAEAIFGAERLLIVTQSYHLPRALYIASRLGLEAVGIPCDTRRYAGQLHRDIRELLARDKDFFQCVFLPEPTYLGESIPLTGSGDATNDRG